MTILELLSVIDAKTRKRALRLLAAVKAEVAVMEQEAARNFDVLLQNRFANPLRRRTRRN